MAKKLSEKEQQEKVLKYIELVKIIRNSKDKIEKDLAFEEIIQMMGPKLNQFMYNFTIPGHDRSDIYQEALFALKYKAIKDYDSSRSELKDISPFDKFAMICIRRHLSTKLKASYQNKNRVLNSSMSLNQDRNTDSDSNLYLSDILVEPNADDSIMQGINHKEYQAILFKKLFSKLSLFEKKVFMLYAQKLSYSEMAEKLFELLDEKEKEKILFKHSLDEVKKLCKSKSKKKQEIREKYLAEIKEGGTLDEIAELHVKTYSEERSDEIVLEKIVKSIDNALSRIKTKAKETFEKHG